MLGSELKGKGTDTNGVLKLTCSWWSIGRYLFNEEKGEHLSCENVHVGGFFFMIHTS